MPREGSRNSIRRATSRGKTETHDLKALSSDKFAKNSRTAYRKKRQRDEVKKLQKMFRRYSIGAHEAANFAAKQFMINKQVQRITTMVGYISAFSIFCALLDIELLYGGAYDGANVFSKNILKIILSLSSFGALYYELWKRYLKDRSKFDRNPLASGSGEPWSYIYYTNWISVFRSAFLLLHVPPGFESATRFNVFCIIRIFYMIPLLRIWTEAGKTDGIIKLISSHDATVDIGSTFMWKNLILSAPGKVLMGSLCSVFLICMYIFLTLQRSSFANITVQEAFWHIWVSMATTGGHVEALDTPSQIITMISSFAGIFFSALLISSVQKASKYNMSEQSMHSFLTDRSVFLSFRESAAKAVSLAIEIHFWKSKRGKKRVAMVGLASKLESKITKLRSKLTEQLTIFRTARRRLNAIYPEEINSLLLWDKLNAIEQVVMEHYIRNESVTTRKGVTAALSRKLKRARKGSRFSLTTYDSMKKFNKNRITIAGVQSQTGSAKYLKKDVLENNGNPDPLSFSNGLGRNCLPVKEKSQTDALRVLDQGESERLAQMSKRIERIESGMQEMKDMLRAALKQNKMVISMAPSQPDPNKTLNKLSSSKATAPSPEICELIEKKHSDA